jgi:uncharacterized protein
MQTEQNKKLLEGVFAETAKGNGRPFVAVVADDVTWTIIGSAPWSKKYVGKRAVLKELLDPLSAQLAGGNTITASRLIAEDDSVVVEGRGHNRTKTGKAYANVYRWILRFQGDKVVELTEHADTALIESALEPPSLEPAATRTQRRPVSESSGRCFANAHACALSRKSRAARTASANRATPSRMSVVATAP